MRLLTSLLIAAGACSAQEQANIISSIGNLVSSKRNLALAVGGKVAHFVTAREADRQGKRVKISDQAENTAKYVARRAIYPCVSAPLLETPEIISPPTASGPEARKTSDVRDRVPTHPDREGKEQDGA